MRQQCIGASRQEEFLTCRRSQQFPTVRQVASNQTQSRSLCAKTLFTITCLYRKVKSLRPCDSWSAMSVRSSKGQRVLRSPVLLKWQALSREKISPSSCAGEIYRSKNSDRL